MEALMDNINFFKEGGIMPNFSELERIYGVSRKKIAKIYREGYCDKKITRRRSSELDNYKDMIRYKLTIPGVTLKAIHEFLVDKEDLKTSYSNFRKYVEKNKLNSTIKDSKVVMRYETEKGKQAQVDWKENVTLISKHGEVFTINVFAIVLGYSRKKYFELCVTKTQKDVMNCLINSFQYFGGVPSEILFDNMATVVDRENHYVSSKINNKFKQFSKDFGFEIKLCKVRKPQTKGKVETNMKFIDRIKAYNDEFEDLNDLINIVKNIQDRVNSNISQATNMPPNMLFLNEKKYLKPLNSNSINTYKSLARLYKVSNESLVSYKGNKYSVPIEYIGKQVELRIETNDIHIYKCQLY